MARVLLNSGHAKNGGSRKFDILEKPVTETARHVKLNFARHCYYMALAKAQRGTYRNAIGNHRNAVAEANDGAFPHFRAWASLVNSPQAV